MQVSNPMNTARSFSRSPVAAGVVLALASPALLAQDKITIDEVVVTAQKRTENMQDVPISIQALSGEKLSELNLVNFVDYTKMLPAVATQGGAGAGSSFNLVYMRGIATAGDGQATTSLPSVGMYLDELPITTIQGNLDVHMYDMARVEALAGPQGTLYGASSQSGTIRIISNKPDPSGFDSSISVQGEIVDGDDTGARIEGFVNIPIGDKAAVRIVGWSRSDAGWIDNKAGEKTFYGVEDPDICADAGLPCSADDIVISNKGEDNYNTIDTVGARAALRIDLGDNWTVTPTAMFQNAEGKGSWGDDLNDVSTSGKYAVLHTLPEFVNDDWSMLGLTIEGKIGNFDVVYSGSYLDRSVDASFDYSDYSYWYDSFYTSGYYSDLHFASSGSRVFPNYFADEGYFDPADVGARVMPGARYTNDDIYTKNNHELRISTDPEKSVRGLLGFFMQKQFHDFEQHWLVEGISPVLWPNEGLDPRFTDTVYLNSLYRTDRDEAVFASVDFDIAENMVLTLGARYFQPEVHVKGFFGFGLPYNRGNGGPNAPATFNLWGNSGEQWCSRVVEGTPGWTPSFNGQADWKDKPCLNVDKSLDETGSVYRVNLSWDVSDDAMLYFTWSEGYRPGGVQRDPFAGEYKSDFLTNYEFGWKSQWAENQFQFNGAIFFEQWDDFQVSFTGDNAITAVNNGPSADVTGIEGQIVWVANDKLLVTAAGAFYSSELTDDYCNFTAGVCTTVLAPKGTSLPVTADFKGNLTARYTFPIGSLDAYWQAAVAHNGDRWGDMDVSAAKALGKLPSITTVDFAGGFGRNDWSVDLFVSNLTGEDTEIYRSLECVIETCGPQPYGVRVKPTTVSLRFTKDFN